MTRIINIVRGFIGWITLTLCGELIIIFGCDTSAFVIAFVDKFIGWIPVIGLIIEGAIFLSLSGAICSVLFYICLVLCGLITGGNDTVIMFTFAASAICFILLGIAYIVRSGINIKSIYLFFYGIYYLRAAILQK